MAVVVGVLIHLLPVISLLFISFLCHHVPSLSKPIGHDNALIHFKESLIDQAGISDWDIDSDPCQWPGVECDGDKNIFALDFISKNVSGDGAMMKVEYLANIRTLHTITFKGNYFFGPIPEFNLITNLHELILDGNRFSGEIPDTFFDNMRSLQIIDFGNNNFSGRIPSSIQKLPKLNTLRLHNNSFSGPVPFFSQWSLKVLDLSGNKLRGEIPKELSRFGGGAFERNPDLCGSSISVPCMETPPPAPSPIRRSDDLKQSKSKGNNSKWVILGLVVLLLMASKVLQPPEDDGMIYRDLVNGGNLDDEEMMPELYMAGSSNGRITLANWKGKSSHYDENDDFDEYDHDYDMDDEPSYHSAQRPPSSVATTVSAASASPVLEKRGGNLTFVNEERGVFTLRDLMKAQAEMLVSHGMGSTYKSILANGFCVVVKRMRDMNKLDKDEFDDELRRLGGIRHPNVLPPLAYLHQHDEKLVVYEFIPKGSLFSALHGNHGAVLDWPLRLKIIKGVARGMGFLHMEFSNYELPHGNLKSSNILLSESYDPLLIDYGLFSLIGNTSSMQQSLFVYKCPEAMSYNILSKKSDVYCLGIIVLEIMTGEFPTQYLDANQEGGTDLVKWVMYAISHDKVAELIDPRITSTTESLEQMEKMLYIAAACIEANHHKRIDIREAIRRINEVDLEA